MDEKDDIYKNLITLLKLFKNRPYHLAKFLIDKEALNEKFRSDILNSTKLNELETAEQKKYFKNISDMEDYFHSLLDSSEIKLKTPQQIEKDLNKKLDQLIKEEKYEEAASLRDYMSMKGIKRKSKF